MRTGRNGLVAFREKDTDEAWTDASDGEYEERLYHCRNQRADMVALATPAVYDLRGDLELDGDVELTDRDTLRDNSKGVTLGRGVLSAAPVRNQRGVAGYVAAGYEPSTYLIRHRQAETTIGQRNGRDPIECLTGKKLFEQVQANPARLLDPYGLASQNGPRFNRWERVSAEVAASRAYAHNHLAGNRDPNHNNVDRHCGMWIQALICELPPDPNGPAYGGGREADRCWECCRWRVKNGWRGKFGPQTGDTNWMVGPCGGGDRQEQGSPMASHSTSPLTSSQWDMPAGTSTTAQMMRRSRGAQIL